MAVGEKRLVVMGAEKAVPNGVATLGADGKLAEAQRPDATGIGAADRALSNLTDPQTALYNLGAGVRPNELDNAYFVGGGSQRGGWKIPINQRGLTSWSSPGPIIGRWELALSGSVTLAETGLTVTADSSSPAEIVQKIENTDIKGKTRTISAFTSAGFGFGTITFPANSGEAVVAYDDGINFAIIARVYPDGTPVFDMWTYQGKTVTWFFVKQEDGENQSSAYKKLDENWRIIPQQDADFRSQLLKCQRYYQLYSSAEARPNSPIDCRPVMRTPTGGRLTQGTIVIDGVTYYYNSAEL